MQYNREYKFTCVDAEGMANYDEIVTPIDRESRIVEAFDTITGASYYGAAFRSMLRHNPKALAAAEELARCVKLASNETKAVD